MCLSPNINNIDPNLDIWHFFFLVAHIAPQTRAIHPQQ